MFLKKFATAMLIALAWAIPACDSGGSQPSIVLISIDTLRADHVSAYGYSRPTPNIDALAETGVLFEEKIGTAASE